MNEIVKLFFSMEFLPIERFGQLFCCGARTSASEMMGLWYVYVLQLFIVKTKSLFLYTDRHIRGSVNGCALGGGGMVGYGVGLLLCVT